MRTAAYPDMTQYGPAMQDTFPAKLLGPVLERLGCPGELPRDPVGLATIYSAWCRRVPFDNVRKRLHLDSGSPGPLPGSTAGDFFEQWLAHGVGGTCWAGSNALFVLLRELGFPARRAVATMLARTDAPPNHGTVVVDWSSGPVLVDPVLLSLAPLPWTATDKPELDHPGVPSRRTFEDGRLHVWWRPPHRDEEIACRIEEVDVPFATFVDLHERTRSWGPFNFAVSARMVRESGIAAIGMGRWVETSHRGVNVSTPLSRSSRNATLARVFGMDPALLEHLPDDEPLPPAPGGAIEDQSR